MNECPFKLNDVVKVKPEWLDEGENPDTKYIVVDILDNGAIEVYSDESLGGFSTAFGGTTSIVKQDAFFKVE